MAIIKIERNEEANCINFKGSTVPAYFNACLSASVSGDKVSIRNDIRSAELGEDFFEFSNIPYTDFRDKDNNSFVSAQDAADYITLNGNVAAPTDPGVSYLGAYDADTNTPDVTTDVSGYNNSEWYWVTVAGTSEFASTGQTLKLNDKIRFNGSTNVWEIIPDNAAKIDDIENSSLAEYDIYVDADYTGTIRTGSSVHPYVDLSQAIAEALDNSSILIKGSITVPNSPTDAFPLPVDKSLDFHGAKGSSVGYESYDSENGEVFRYVGVLPTKSLGFYNLKITNAGGYGIRTFSNSRVDIEDCVLQHNGWNATELSTILPNSVSGILGYDSSSAELQAFYAGSNASDGGAMRIESSTVVNIIANTVSENLRGIRLQDCGIGGAGFVTRNVSTKNIESGIYLAPGSLGGCQGIVVSMNSSAYNANNGLLCIGGINNKFSQNEVTGNWNAGFCAWGAANTTLRDCGLYDNNRSAYNGIGNVGDAKASIQINEAYNLLGTTIGLNPSARFIAEILDTQVHYTGLGSNTERVGFLITSDVGALADNDKNIIKVDDVGFIGQDYAIDLSEVDLTNLRLTLGDNSYMSIGEKAVREPLIGSYYELPFSNHTTKINYADISVDPTGNVTILEGIDGMRLNPYKVNELEAVVDGDEIRVILKDSRKIQFNVPVLGCSINEVFVDSDINQAIIQLNDLFTDTAAVNPVVDTSLNGVDVSFKLDPTSTSIIFDNGYQYGVNTIKAVDTGDGLITIKSIEDARVLFTELDHTMVDIDGVDAAGGLNDVINVLNELFTVGAFESVVISDPYSTMTANVNGEPSGYTLEGSTIVDPVGDDLATNSSSGNYAGVLSVATINQAGEYFTFDIRGEGQIGFGLVHTQESFDAGYFSGSSSYANPSSFAGSNSAHYGFQFSHWFHPTPNGSWTNYGANTSYSMRSGWSNFNGTDEQADWLAGNPIKVRVGLDANGFISIETLRNGTDWVVHARTSYNPAEGSEFKLGIKFANSSPRLYTAPKVHLLDTPQTPTTLGTDAITVFGEGITGTLAGGISSSATDDFDNDGFVTTQTINSSGEFFEFTWSAGGDANFGLFSENDHDVSDLTSDTASWGNNDYIFYGARAESNGVINDVYVENNLPFTTIGSSNDPTAVQYYGRVGFDGQGRPTVWYSVDGVTYTVFHHGQAAAPSGEYKFIWVAQQDGAIFDTLEQGVIDTAPVMYFRYIESPDGAWSYPLFATEEEADYYELTESGVDNGSHQHIYPDDPTNTTWYMPNTSHQMNYGLSPVGQGITFENNVINWTEITSLTNSELAPNSFSFSDYTFAENVPVALQVSPQGASFTTTVSGLPSGLTFTSGYLISGTTRHVYGDQIYPITVTRTNSYGSTDATFNLTITDDVSQNAISGMTIYGQNPITQSPDIIHHYSGVVNLDVDLSLDAGTEIIWTQQNDNPSGGVGQYLQIGIANVGIDKATTQLGNNPQYWQVKATIWTDTLNHNYATGWTDSSDSAYSESNDNIEWKIAFPSDGGPIELYRAGVLVRTSSANFTGSQTLTVGIPLDYSTTIRMPSFTKADTVFVGDPPAGFTQEYGSMDSTTTLSSDSVVSLDMVLPIGKRLLVNKSWIEANVLPYCTDTLEKAYIGVPKTSAVWGSVDLHTDFDAVMRWEGQSSTAHKTTIADGSDEVARHESDIGSATNAYYHYAIEWDGTNLVVLRDTDISKFSSQHDYTQFNTYSAYENYSAQSGDLPLVMATKSGGTMTLSMSGISLVDIPAAPITILTPWTKALDFSGGSEHLKQVTQSTGSNAIRMSGLSLLASANSDSSKTSSHTYSRPWATAIVFQTPNNNTNQHIWNSGEGTSTGSDNIYLRMSGSNGELYFGWGREGVGYNEYHIGNLGGSYNQSTGQWWGIYISHDGTRLSATDATAANLTNAFDIRLMGTNDVTPVFSTLYNVGNDVNNWTSTGVRMDRVITGDFTIGGRGANRSFHGKVASMVVTTLRKGVTKPTDAEIKLMITDPMKWEDDYKDGQTARYSYTGSNFTYGPSNSNSKYATQIWLMGDGTSDSYANGVRNHVDPTDQNNTKLQLNSMVSNDIQNVTISGLS